MTDEHGPTRRDKSVTSTLKNWGTNGRVGKVMSRPLLVEERFIEHAILQRKEPPGTVMAVPTGRDWLLDNRNMKEQV